MRVVFPEPEPPGLSVRVIAVEPLPEDREAWRGEGEVELAQTPTGWPLAIVSRERSVLGFYELFDRGVVVEVTGDRESARRLLLAGDLDRTQREVVALSQLWDDA